MKNTIKRNFKRAVSGMLLAASMLTLFAFGASAATVDADNTATSIPVQISAQATTFNVTLPTALPATVDPATGKTAGASNATIRNDSAGPIRISQIAVINKTSAEMSGVATGWALKDYDDFDFANANVDSNYVGISVRPVGGRSALAAGAGTALMTTDESESLQTLLTYTKGGGSNTASAGEWILDAANAGDTDELTISYDTEISRVSADITNQQVGTLVITVAWNKG